jgi:hypothetical protein
MALMKTLVSQCDYNNEKTPTITSSRMNGAWTDNIFLLGSNSPIDSIVFIVEVVDIGGLGVEWLIKLLLLLFICWKKEYWKSSNVEGGKYIYIFCN